MGINRFRGKLTCFIYFLCIFVITVVTCIIFGPVIGWIVEICLCVAMNISYPFVEKIACHDTKFEKNYSYEYKLGFTSQSVIISVIMYLVTVIVMYFVGKNYIKLKEFSYGYGQVAIAMYYLIFVVGCLINEVSKKVINGMLKRISK